MRAKGSCSVAASVGVTRVAAYQVGMLGTVINVLAFRSVIAARGYRGMLMIPRDIPASPKLILNLAYGVLDRDTSSYVRVEQGIHLSRRM